MIARLRDLLKRLLHRCAERGCWKRGLRCTIWDPMPAGDVFEYVCWDHLRQAGYCYVCRSFAAGMESFDFGRYPGSCESCAAELRAQREEEEALERDEWDGSWDPEGGPP